MEQFFERTLAHSASSEEGQKPSEKCKFTPDPADASPTGSFDCNICLEMVQDPVVTMCGHLYCWPCIYKWLDLQKHKIPTEEDQDNGQQQCPVCKAEVSETTLVPLYGRGLNKKASKGKDSRLVLMIPKRPLSLGSGFETPRTPRTTSMSPRVMGQQLHYQDHNFGSSPTSYQYSPYASLPSPSMLSPGAQLANLMDPVMGMFGEAVYERAFGGSVMNVYGYPNSYNFVGTTSPRIRRHIVQADRSLARLCFFFFCCVLLCLLSF